MATQNSWNNSNTGNTGTVTIVGSPINISADAATATINVGTGAAAKTVTVGSTNTTSSLALNFGTGDFSLASATGNIMVVQDTGEINYPLQSAAFSFLGATDSNVTGNGTLWRLGQTTALTEVFDQNADMNTNGIWTAPVTGRYLLIAKADLGVPAGSSNEITSVVITSNRNYSFQTYPTRNRVTNFFAGNNALTLAAFVFMDMDAGDTANYQVAANNGALTTGVVGSASLVFSHIEVVLVC